MHWPRRMWIRPYHRPLEPYSSVGARRSRPSRHSFAHEHGASRVLQQRTSVQFPTLSMHCGEAKCPLGSQPSSRLGSSSPIIDEERGARGRPRPRDVLGAPHRPARCERKGHTAAARSRRLQSVGGVAVRLRRAAVDTARRCPPSGEPNSRRTRRSSSVYSRTQPSYCGERLAPGSGGSTTKPCSHSRDDERRGEARGGVHPHRRARAPALCPIQRLVTAADRGGDDQHARERPAVVSHCALWLQRERANEPARSAWSTP